MRNQFLLKVGLRHVIERRFLAIFLFGLATAAQAVQTSQVEDFTSTTFRDSAATTADWNTSAGELGLFAFEPERLGAVSIGGDVLDIEVDGVRLFVSTGAGGLHVVDATDPTSPLLLGSLALDSYDLDVDGSRAFVATMGNGFVSVDVSDPTSMAPLDTLALTGIVRDVRVVGNLALVCEEGLGVRLVDVSRPDSLSMVSLMSPPGIPRDVEVAGNVVYIANDNYLDLYDITDPSNPAFLGWTSATMDIADIEVYGDHIYAACGAAGLQVFNVTTPSQPILLGSVAAMHQVTGLDIVGDWLYMADGSAGVRVLDIRNPSMPDPFSTIATSAGAVGVALHGDIAFAALGVAGLETFRVAAAPSDRPMPLASHATGGYHVDAVEDLIYLSTTTELRIFDVEDPSSPTLLGTYGGSYLRDVEVDGDLALLGDAGNLLVLDVGNPSSPSLLGSLALLGYVDGIDIQGDLAYLAMGALRVVDLTDPSNPSLVGEYTAFSFDACDVEVSGDLAFVADESTSSEFHIFDVSDPASPTPIWSYSFSTGTVRDVAVDGHLVYLAVDGYAIRVLDVQDPLNPVWIDYFSPPGINSYTRVELSGSLLYVGNGIGGYKIVDASVPSSLVELFYGGSSIVAVEPFGDYLVTTSFSEGMKIIPIWQRRFDPSGNQARSSTLDPGGDTKVAARFQATYSDSIRWSLTLNNSTTATAAPGVWVRPSSGDDLRWRAELFLADPVTAPVCQDITVEWLYEYPVIASITDVPGDQGGVARMRIRRSGYDFAEETIQPITQYFVYRRVDDPTALAWPDRSLDPIEGKDEPGSLPELGEDVPLLKVDGRVFVDARGVKSAAVPEGIWEVVGSAPAHQIDDTIVLVPTVADSSSVMMHSVYTVSAETTTPSIFFFSPPDSGYSVDNLAPSAPASLLLSAGELSWDASPNSDFDYFTVYGSASPDLSGAAILGQTTGISLDVSGSSHGYLLVTATDFAGNESEPAVADGTTGVEETPTAFRLLGATPNPFNPETEIRFELPGERIVDLKIYNVSGRLVRKLLQGRQLPAGRHGAEWDGRDERGRSVSTGVYFYRLSAGSDKDYGRMVLLK